MFTSIITLSLLSLILIFLLVVVFNLFKQNVFYRVIKEHGSPYSIIVNNTQYKNDQNRKKDKNTAVLFGLNSYLLTPNFGSDIPITVTPQQTNVSYIELLNQSAHQPFSTRLISFRGKIDVIRDIVLTYTQKDANGMLYQYPIMVEKLMDIGKVDLNDTENDQTVDIKYNLKIDGNSQISFDLKPESKVIVNIFYNTVQYTMMGVFSYIKNLIKGNLPKILLQSIN
jgi:hypothetical protein